MDQKKLLGIQLDPVLIYWIALLFLLFIYFFLFMVDSRMTEPFFIYVFDIPLEDAKWYARGMALVFLCNAFVSSKLLARGENLLFFISVGFFLLLNVFSFLGQEVAMILQTTDVFGGVFEEEDPLEEASSIQHYRHYISVGLTITLYGFAVLIEFLIARASEDVKDIKKSLSLSSLYRWFQSKITLLQREYDRALKRLNVLAKDKVDDQIETLNNQISECEQKERHLLGEQRYQDKLIDLMHQQRIAIIEAVYAKKPPFFKRFFS